MDVFGREPHVTIRQLLATILVVPILPVNARFLVPSTPSLQSTQLILQFLIFLLPPVVVTITPAVIAVFQILHACGIQTRSLTANPKSSVISLTVD